jgi:hypothetical protein
MRTGRAPTERHASPSKINAWSLPGVANQMPTNDANDCSGTAKLWIGCTLAIHALALVVTSKTVEGCAPLQ